MYCLILAAIAIIPTAFTGDQLLDREQAHLAEDYLKIAHVHRALALASLGLILSAAAIRIAQKNHLKKIWGLIYSVLIVLISGFISVTGHFGGMLVHGKDYLSGIF